MGRRLALLIGISRFDDRSISPLNAPVSDVRAFDEVLRDPAICNFDSVDLCLDEPYDSVRNKISRLTRNRERDDLILLYYSGHGVLEFPAELHLLTRNTMVENLDAASFSAEEIRTFLRRSNSRRQILILDCCYAGAYAADGKKAGAQPAVTRETFDPEGYGRVVMLATSEAQPAPDGQAGTGLTSPYTSMIVEALRNGLPSANSDAISAQALAEHVEVRARRDGLGIQPRHLVDSQAGPLVLVSGGRGNRSPGPTPPGPTPPGLTPPDPPPTPSPGDPHKKEGWRPRLVFAGLICILALAGIGLAVRHQPSPTPIVVPEPAQQLQATLQAATALADLEARVRRLRELSETYPNAPTVQTALRAAEQELAAQQRQRLQAPLQPATEITDLEARLQRLRELSQTYPNEPSIQTELRVAEQGLAAQQQQQQLQAALRAAAAISGPGARVQGLRELSQTYPNEPSVQTALRAAEQGLAVLELAAQQHQLQAALQAAAAVSDPGARVQRLRELSQTHPNEVSVQTALRTAEQEFAAQQRQQLQAATALSDLGARVQRLRELSQTYPNEPSVQTALRAAEQDLAAQQQQLQAALRALARQVEVLQASFAPLQASLVDQARLRGTALGGAADGPIGPEQRADVARRWQAVTLLARRNGGEVDRFLQEARRLSAEVAAFVGDGGRAGLAGVGELVAQNAALGDQAARLAALRDAPLPAPRLALRGAGPVEFRLRDPASRRELPSQSLAAGQEFAVGSELLGWWVTVVPPGRLEVLLEGRALVPGVRQRWLREFRLVPEGLLDGAGFEAVSADPPMPPASLNSARCQAIQSRVRIGEPLSEADRAFLQSGCRG